MISIIIPAHNEEHYISACLEALLASNVPDALSVQVLVVANGCTDRTVPLAQAQSAAFARKGWLFEVLTIGQGSKILALNAGDHAAKFDKIAYIDADIRVSPNLIAQLEAVLEKESPAYASGQLHVPPARSYLSRCYARFWQRLPFLTKGVPGCGVFAVNAAGRARWSVFPEVISDDTFVRYHFTPEEMHGVPASFLWPISEGFANLVRVRRRQDAGLAEIRRLYPDLAQRMPATAPDRAEKLRLILQDPIGFLVYSAVALTVRLPVLHNRSGWDRGR